MDVEHTLIQGMPLVMFVLAVWVTLWHVLQEGFPEVFSGSD